MEQEKETVEGRAVKTAAERMADLYFCNGLCKFDEMIASDKEHCARCLEHWLLDQAATELIVEDKTTETEAVEHRAAEIAHRILKSQRMCCRQRRRRNEGPKKKRRRREKTKSE